ncbi:MAG: porin family protein [Thermoanaerobaculia bacterium]
MHQTIRPFAVLAVLTLGALPARAGDSPWFARAKFGQADVDAAFGEPVFGRRVDDEDGTAAVELGYRFGPHLAIQAGYHDLGEYEGLELPCPLAQPCPDLDEIPFRLSTVELTGVSLSLVPRLPLGERFSLFGTIGVIDWNADIVADTGGDTIDSFDGQDLLAGVGLGYDLPSGLGFQLELEGFELDAVALTAGVGWRF